MPKIVLSRNFLFSKKKARFRGKGSVRFIFHAASADNEDNQLMQQDLIIATVPRLDLASKDYRHKCNTGEAKRHLRRHHHDRKFPVLPELLHAHKHTR